MPVFSPCVDRAVPDVSATSFGAFCDTGGPGTRNGLTCWEAAFPTRARLVTDQPEYSCHICFSSLFSFSSAQHSSAFSALFVFICSYYSTLNCLFFIDFPSSHSIKPLPVQKSLCISALVPLTRSQFVIWNTLSLSHCLRRRPS